MNAQFVADIKNDLISRGIIPTEQSTNCHAFDITGRVAWHLRGEGAKLVRKTKPQNGCYKDGENDGFSHDAIAFPSKGFWADILSSAGPPDNGNGPVWQQHTENFPPNLADPFDMGFGIPSEEPPVEGEETELQRLNMKMDLLLEAFQKLIDVAIDVAVRLGK